jgi:hypothetical protein
MELIYTDSDENTSDSCKEAHACRYCGSSAIIVEYNWYDMCRYEVFRYKMQCDDCGASGPEYVYASKDPPEVKKEVIAKALTSWNMQIKLEERE